MWQTKITGYQTKAISSSWHPARFHYPPLLKGSLNSHVSRSLWTATAALLWHCYDVCVWFLIPPSTKTQRGSSGNMKSSPEMYNSKRRLQYNAMHDYLDAIPLCPVWLSAKWTCIGLQLKIAAVLPNPYTTINQSLGLSPVWFLFNIFLMLCLFLMYYGAHYATHTHTPAPIELGQVCIGPWKECPLTPRWPPIAKNQLQGSVVAAPALLHHCSGIGLSILEKKKHWRLFWVRCTISRNIRMLHSGWKRIDKGCSNT